MTKTEITTCKDYVEWMAGIVAGYAALAEKGEHFTTRAPVKSVPDAKAWAKSEKPKPQQCYMNAQKFVLDHEGAKYYEGYWMGAGMPVHHGWVVLDGVVIDFTAEACNRHLKRQGIKSTDSKDYFGVHIPTAFVRKIAFSTKVWGGMMWKYLISEDYPMMGD